MKLTKQLKSYLKTLRESNKKKLILKGIQSKNKAFTGPLTVEIDLTDLCSNSCIVCWTHSPLLENEPAADSIPLADLLRLLKDLKKLAVRKIRFSGAGDPFLYKDIYPLLKKAKHFGFITEVNTSLIKTPSSFEKILTEKLIDDLTISLWAGNESVWLKMHPGQSKDKFRKIITSLELIKEIRQSNKYIPRVKFYNIITSYNYKNIAEMVDLAIRMEADRVEFQAPDIFSEKLKFLELNQAEAKETRNIFRQLLVRDDYTSYFIGKNNKLDLDNIGLEAEQKEFGRFYYPVILPFTIKSNPHNVLCPAGEKSVNIAWTAPQPYPRLSFEFNNSLCPQCSFSKKCYKTPQSLPLETGFLELTGVGTFLRRITNLAGKNDADNNTLNLPCTTAWVYSRIKSDGSVIPCCKGSEYILGNIKTKKFKDIWYSKKMNEFRQNSVLGFARAQAYSGIKCLKGCDNIGEILNTLNMA